MQFGLQLEKQLTYTRNTVIKHEGITGQKCFHFPHQEVDHIMCSVKHMAISTDLA